MSVVGLLDAVGLIVGVGMMIPALMPEKPPDPQATTTVNIGVGLHGNPGNRDPLDYKGDTPTITLYDQLGTLVGRSGSEGHVKAGGVVEMAIAHEKDMGGVKSEYMAVAASGDDAICIQYITTLWPDQESWGFLGDVGTLCDADWYYSDNVVANFDSSSQEPQSQLNRSSNCIWVDQNGSNHFRFQGFSFHILDFSSSKDADTDGRAKQYHDQPATMCKSDPRFKSWPKISKDTVIPIFYDLIHYNSDNSDLDPKAVLDKKRWCYKDKHTKNKNGCSSTPPSKREARASSSNPAPPFMAGTVVKSHHGDHNATHLCNSKTSKGPDFVSLSEGVFCDMEKKQVWPLCSKEVAIGCFDVETNKMRPGPHGRRDSEGRRIPFKSYHKEIRWGGGI